MMWHNHSWSGSHNFTLVLKSLDTAEFHSLEDVGSLEQKWLGCFDSTR